MTNQQKMMQELIKQKKENQNKNSYNRAVKSTGKTKTKVNPSLGKQNGGGLFG